MVPRFRAAPKAATDECFTRPPRTARVCHMAQAHHDERDPVADGTTDERAADAAAPEVIYDEEASRFEVRVAGSDDVAFLEVVPGKAFWTFTHTEVPESFRGRGVGSRLVGGALQHVRDLGSKVRPLCPFVVEFLKQNPEELDVVHPRFRSDLG